MQKTLVLASNNPGKLREFNAMFSEKAIHIVGQGSMGVRACEEPYHTFLENALAKARNAARESGLPALADDSGIAANALNGEPGVFSARYAGADCDDKANNAKLVAALKDKFPSLAARADSGTTRIFICLNSGKRPPNSRQRKKMPSVIAGKPCVPCSKPSGSDGVGSACPVRALALVRAQVPVL